MTEIEEWRTIIIDGKNWNYEISNLGNIRVSSTKILRKIYSRGGYVACTIFDSGTSRTCLVHRLVAQAFLQNPPSPKHKFVNHINHNPSDNCVENLEWTTHAENIKHAHQKDGRKFTGIAVIRTDLDGSNPLHYESVADAKRDNCNGASGSYIYEVLAGRAQQAYGYKWSYETSSPNKVSENTLDMTKFVDVQNHPNFMVSYEGQIYNKTRQTFLTPRICGSYLSVVLDKKHYCVHVLVARHFLEDKQDTTQKWIVNHKDGNKLNNHCDNLEWLTLSQNTNHAYQNGLRSNMRPIVQMDMNGNIIKEYLNAQQVAKEFNQNIQSQIHQTCKRTNNNIYRGYRWKYKEINVEEITYQVKTLDIE